MGILADFDLTPGPGVSERALLTKRLNRLTVRSAPDGDGEGWLLSARWATANFERVPGSEPRDLLIRREFSWRSADPPVSISDRKPPGREHRPSATRILDSRGAALRLYLIILAVAHKTRWRTATHANELPLAGDFGWVDLVAGRLKKQGAPRMVASDRDDRLRTVHAALRSLQGAGLVELPNDGRPKGTYDGFIPLREGGLLLPASVRYTLPTTKDVLISLPYTFITNGWVHLLEDSEIALLLMVACGAGSLEVPGLQPGWVAIPAATRLARYGLSRDAFDAHRMLKRFGLLDVYGLGRHDEDLSRVREYGKKEPQLHRLHLRREGFEEPALDVVPTEVARRLRE
ncbi:hypothetical protein [Cellulomonas septica]|uniref:Uncharacterized protein n=1 Tax=Cellulomonas septica TaxID=285080 RepID=A0ABX1JV16_9CELL|nr:hypothetical protein [Cellulomonas septica]NKY38159.1 hypothetical protein [Cellulomonas septica]